MTTDETAVPSAGQAGALPFDTTKAHQARVYDHLLGGKDNYAADRAAAEEMLKAYPDTAFTARANRAFLGRAVRYSPGKRGSGSSSTSAPASRPPATPTRSPRRSPRSPGWSTWTTTRSSSPTPVRC
jgi:hypothetical protein